MTSRRNFVQLVGSALGSLTVTRSFSKGDPCNGARSLPQAPDAFPISGFRQQLITIDQGSLGTWDTISAVQRNFARVLEQNFSQLPEDRVSRLVADLTPQEFTSLASMYAKHSLNSGLKPQLLDILAARLGASHLGNISNYFGFQEVYSAVLRVAPQKAAQALPLMNRNSISPITASTVSRKGELSTMGDPLLDYTFTEIYLSYRTAPVGSLSVASALYESASFIGTRMSLSFGAGYAVGTVLNDMWKNYSPETYATSADFLGRTVDGFANGVSSLLNGSAYSNASMAVRIAIGGLQESLYNSFGSPGIRSSFYLGGADYKVNSAWQDKVYMSQCR